MFFFEVKNQAFISKEQLTCPRCNKPHLKSGNGLHYLSFGILPVLPLSVKRLQTCSSCRFHHDGERIALTSVPLHQLLVKLVGIVLFVSAMLYVYTSWQAEKKWELEVLRTPQIDDFYFIDYSKFKEEDYYQKRVVAAKVIAVDDEKVWFTLANYMYSLNKDLVTAARLSNFIHQGYFTNQLYSVPKSQLMDYFESGKIYRAHRPRYLKLYGGFVLKPKQPAPLYKGFNPNQANEEGIQYYQDGQFDLGLKPFGFNQTQRF